MTPRDTLAAEPRAITGHVAGRFLEPRGKTIEVVDPATERVVAVLHESDAEEVDRAVTAARRAFDAGPWPRASVAERRRVLVAIHDRILAHADELAALETVDTGIPLTQTAGMHVPRAALNFRFFAEVIEQKGGEVFDQEEGVLSLVTREPVGACALIGPWNMPLGLTAMKIAGALAFGNSCVVKPSEKTPLTLARLFELVADLVPEGVLNLVNGRGAVTGAALVAHPGIDMASFTGGTETGAAILRALAPGIKGAAMELGGKSASLVLDDADLELALDGAMLGAFMNNGQMCLAGSRILVARSVAEPFVERFAERVRALRLGDPFDPATEIGPMIDDAQRERMAAYARSGAAEGARLLTGGGARAEGFERGFYAEPTAMLAPDNDLAICREEIFGPFATLQIVEDEEEAIARANDSKFGLVGYVWSAGLERALRVASALRTGTVMVNTPILRDLRTAFGGYKRSGLGREGAEGSRAMFTETKTTIVARERRRFPRMGLG